MLASVKDDDSLITVKEENITKDDGTQALAPDITEEKDSKDEWAKYRVISVLGQGSYGTVYKVERVSNSTTSQ